jgi:hypothetical protein
MLISMDRLSLEHQEGVSLEEQKARKRGNTHDREGINDDSIDMRAVFLVRNLSDLMYDVRPQAELLYPVDDASRVSDGVDEKNGTFGKGGHPAEHTLDRTLADLRGDCEEELAPFQYLALNPHVTLHERDKAFRDGQT